MFEKIVQSLTVVSLILLAGSGVLLTIGHSPTEYPYNFQAESLANFAFFLFVLTFLVRLGQAIKES